MKSLPKAGCPAEMDAWFALLAMISAATEPILQAPATEDSQLNASVANATHLAKSYLGTERPKLPARVLSVN